MTAHAVYNDSRRLANNNGKVDKTLMSQSSTTMQANASSAASSSTFAARTKNPTGNATFVQSAACIGATMREAWQGAAKSSITIALEDLHRGRPTNMNRMGEIAAAILLLSCMPKSSLATVTMQRISNRLQLQSALLLKLPLSVMDHCTTRIRSRHSAVITARLTTGWLQTHLHKAQSAQNMHSQSAINVASVFFLI